MLKPERRYEIQQEIRARQAVRATRIAIELPLDSLEPEEEEEQSREEVEDEMAPMEVEKPEEPDQEMSAFNLEQAEAK